jgi:hypothetical protein
MNPEKHVEFIIDFVTGKRISLVGAEENRQAVEKLLVHEKGFQKSDIDVGVPFRIRVPNERRGSDGLDPEYESRIDLVVKDAGGEAAMVIKCAAGSLGSRDREALAAARLLAAYQIPFVVISDGRAALVYDTVSGKCIGSGVDRIPDRATLNRHMTSVPRVPLEGHRRLREGLIFRSYDSMNLNVMQRPQD